MKQLAVQDLQAHCVAQPTLLLDVREPWEVSLAAITLAGTSALAIPMTQLPTRLRELDSEQSIVCICHHGVRSAQVVAFLTHHGFDAVYNLSGGIAAWSQFVDADVPTY